MAEKKINGKTYRVSPLLATEAIRLQARILKVLGPAVDRMPEIFDGMEQNEDGSIKPNPKGEAAALTAIADIFTKSDPDVITYLIKDICEVAQIKRPSGSYESVDFDGDFTGSLKDMLQVAVFVLREQFGDFFSGLLQSGNRGNQAADSQSLKSDE